MTRSCRESELIVTTGVGKSGDVARLGASLLQSVGIPAQFVHATDLLHGGLGVFHNVESVLIGVSHSGTTAEVLTSLRMTPSYVRTGLITSGTHQFVDHLVRYECGPDGSKHKTIPFASAVAQVQLFATMASEIANSLPAETLGNFHPAGNLSKEYKK